VVGVAASRRAPARAAARRGMTTACGSCGEERTGGRRRQRHNVRWRDAAATGPEGAATRPTTGTEASCPPPPHPPAEAGNASRPFGYRRRWWCRRGKPAGEEEKGWRTDARRKGAAAVTAGAGWDTATGESSDGGERDNDTPGTEVGCWGGGVRAEVVGRRDSRLWREDGGSAWQHQPSGG